MSVRILVIGREIWWGCYTWTCTPWNIWEIRAKTRGLPSESSDNVLTLNWRLAPLFQQFSSRWDCARVFPRGVRRRVHPFKNKCRAVKIAPKLFPGSGYECHIKCDICCGDRCPPGLTFHFSDTRHEMEWTCCNLRAEEAQEACCSIVVQWMLEKRRNLVVVAAPVMDPWPQELLWKARSVEQKLSQTDILGEIGFEVRFLSLSPCPATKNRESCTPTPGPSSFHGC